MRTTRWRGRRLSPNRFPWTARGSGCCGCRASMRASDRLGDYAGMERAQGAGLPTGGDRCISNIVMMGMGEPLYNFEAVRDALAVVQDGDGLAISKRRITLSTSGVVPMIERAGAEIGVMLAVSLHAVTDELRERLVP